MRRREGVRVEEGSEIGKGEGCEVRAVEGVGIEVEN